jgi:hypothetical protein
MTHTTMTLVVKQPEVEHKIRMCDFERWLESNGRSAGMRQRRLWSYLLSSGGGTVLGLGVGGGVGSDSGGRER